MQCKCKEMKLAGFNTPHTVHTRERVENSIGAFQCACECGVLCCVIRIWKYIFFMSRCAHSTHTLSDEVIRVCAVRGSQSFAVFYLAACDCDSIFVLHDDVFLSEPCTSLVNSLRAPKWKKMWEKEEPNAREKLTAHEKSLKLKQTNDAREQSNSKLTLQLFFFSILPTSNVFFFA